MSVKELRKCLHALKRAERLFDSQMRQSNARVAALTLRGQHLTAQIDYYRCYHFEPSQKFSSAGLSTYAQKRLNEALQSTIQERTQLDEALRKLHKQKHILSSRRADFARKLRKAEDRLVDRH